MRIVVNALSCVHKSGGRDIERRERWGRNHHLPLLTTASQARQRSTVGKPLNSWGNWKQKAGGGAMSIKFSYAIHEFPFRSAGP
jgi:hypothetical protein